LGSSCPAEVTGDMSTQGTSESHWPQVGDRIVFVGGRNSTNITCEVVEKLTATQIVTDRGRYRLSWVVERDGEPVLDVRSKDPWWSPGRDGYPEGSREATRLVAAARRQRARADAILAAEDLVDSLRKHADDPAKLRASLERVAARVNAMLDTGQTS